MMQYNYKKYIVDTKNYQVVRLIDKGGFGLVNEVRDKSTGEKLAAKVIISDKNDFKSKQAINREILIMIRCQHPTIINFRGFSIEELEEKTQVTIFMDLAEKNSLFNLIKKARSGTADHSYDNTMIQIILVGIAGGMMHLHRHNIIHCDLKPANILLDSHYHPHLTDFGLSQIFKFDSKILNSKSTEFGTIIYMAPEVIENNIYNRKIDVYSFGIMMYEIITNSIPFPELEKDEKFTIFKFQNKVVNEDYRPKFVVPVKESLKKLIEKCWSKDPQNRPSFEEIFHKLAYNFTESIFERDDDDDEYYLEDVDVEEVIAYADSIQFSDNSNQLDQVLKKFQALEKSISPLMNENDAIKKENLKIKKDFAALQASNNKLIKENNEIKTQLKKIIDDEINPLREANDELKNENNAIKTELKNIIEDEFNPLREENDELKNENKAVKTQLKKLINNEINPLKEANDELINENKAVKTQLKKLIDNEINPLKEANNKLIKENKTIKTQLKKIINDEINSLKEENENLKKQLIKISKHEDEISEIKATETKEDSKTKSFIDINKITINEFNSLPLQVQQTCISKILSNKKKLKFFKEINNLLQYLLKFSPTDKSSYFRISANDDDLLYKINENHIICILSDSLVLLFNNRQLSTSSTFLNILQQFKIVSFEINYPMNNIESILTILSIFKMSQEIIINVFITNTDKVDSFFQNRKNINSFSLDFTVTRIEEGAFSGCSLEEIIIPESVSSIGSKAFMQCTSLKKIKIPCSIDKLNEETFSGCSSLTEIELPSSIKTIGYNCFNGVKSLEISGDIQYIPGSAFSGCSSLTKITIPSSVQTIGDYAFSGCSSLTNIAIPSSVKTIGDYAFSRCFSFTITIPSSVKTFGNDCFDGVTSLEISGDIQCIPDNLFSGYSSLTNITIPSSVQMIGDHAFSGCESLAKITIPSSVKTFGNSIFGQCIRNNQTLQLLGDLQSIPNGLFSSSQFKSVIIPSTVKTIGDNAFSSCRNLSEMIIPASVTYIGKECFSNCSKLQNIKFESLKTRIEYNSFDNCYKLSSCSLSSIQLSGYSDNITSFNKYHGEIQYNFFFLINKLIDNQDRNDIISNFGTYRNRNLYRYSNLQKNSNSDEKQSPNQIYKDKIASILSILYYISSKLSESDKSTPDLSYINIHSSNYKIHINPKVVSILHLNEKKSIPSVFNHDYIVFD